MKKRNVFVTMIAALIIVLASAAVCFAEVISMQDGTEVFIAPYCKKTTMQVPMPDGTAENRYLSMVTISTDSFSQAAYYACMHKSQGMMIDTSINSETLNITDSDVTVEGAYPVIDDGRVLLEFDEPQRAMARGQSAVFYDGDAVVGGGIIL